jgi:two-component system, OmpR family, sensor histidine kinase TctE
MCWKPAPPMLDSLRGALLAWLIPPLLLLLAVDTYLTHQATRHVVNSAHDRSLEGAARAIADAVFERDGVIEVELPYAAFEMLETQVKERIYYAVVTADGTVLAGYPDLPRTKAGRVDEVNPSIDESDYRGERIRTVTLSKRVYGARNATNVNVAVAETVVSRERLVRSLLNDALRGRAAQVLAIALLVGLGVAVSLRPLGVLRDRIRARDATDLSPVETRALPRELRPLAEAFNLHSARVAGVLAAHERFLSDASHQLRTPLTLLKTQAELLARCSDPTDRERLQQAMVDTTDQTVRLARQLLAMARSEPGTSSGDWQIIDLATLVADTLREQVEAARARRIEFDFDPGAGQHHIPGDRTLLHELFTNLIDNAIHYSPDGGVIEVRISALPGEVQVLIRDQGPGIAPEERARVFERFYRVPGNRQEGSGLGLAIVRQVCEAHRARITLGDSPRPPGLQIALHFSRHAQKPEASGPRAP